MLVAICDGVRITAVLAEKVKDYFCPECNRPLTVKQGPKVIYHYAHKPPVTCQWAGSRETLAHLEAKQLVFSALHNRGVRVELEYVVDTQVGDRRADVMAWSTKGTMTAIELQHSSIGRADIERRAHSYASEDIAQIWIPFIDPKVWKKASPTNSGWFVRRYIPRDFEIWVYLLNNGKGMWMFDPKERKFFLGTWTVHRIYVPQSTYYRDGEEFTGGDYHKDSQEYKELTLKGPYNFEDLRVVIKQIRAMSENGYNFPLGLLAHLDPV